MYVDGHSVAALAAWPTLWLTFHGALNCFPLTANIRMTCSYSHADKYCNSYVAS